jgi:hypothetical protein
MSTFEVIFLVELDDGQSCENEKCVDLALVLQHLFSSSLTVEQNKLERFPLATFIG